MRHASHATSEPGGLEALRAEFDAKLAALRAEMGARVEVLERGRGPRDAADLAVVPAIGMAAEGLPFKANHVMVRAGFTPALAQVLKGADIDNARQLGKLLARLEGIEVDGYRLERIGDRRGGWLWRCVHVSHV